MAELRAMRRLWLGVVIPLLFFILPLLFMWKLTIAGRILVGGDPLNFFYPYHDGVASALAAGRLPEWNPYLFGGVPLLADSQAQFFYPLSWLFWGMNAPAALTWNVVLHLGIAGIGTYAWARRGLGMGEVGAWVAGVVFALGGYLGAQVEHVNQVAAAAWIPWILLGYELGRGTVLDGNGDPVTEVGNSPQRWRTRGWGALLGAAALGLSLLAGHAQTTFMGLVLLGLWAIRWALRDDARTKREVLRAQRGGGYAPVVAAAWRNFVGVNFVPLLWVVVLGALLAAIQLAPTQLLSGLSTRAEGLDFREAAAFSFDPRIALRAFLPTFGQDDELLSEYVAWVGFSGLALVALGVWRGRGAAREFGLLSGITGLLLALGGYNPLFWLLWRLVPGFDLFRVPARWLLLWALGAAILAGLGIEQGIKRAESGKQKAEPEQARHVQQRTRLVWLAIGALLIIAFLGLGIFGDFPNVAVLPWWGGALIVTALLVGAGWWLESHPTRHFPLSAFRFLLFAFLLLELWLGSWGLGYQGATAAEAYTGMRPTVAHLLTMQGEAGGGRVLSRSGLTWDPGDLARLEGRYAGQLSEEAIYELVVATKLKEVLAPNQPMRWGIPSADGYGGGLLPSARWVEFQQVLPLAKVVPDGRLREQLTVLPRHELLDVMGVEWLVADKVADWWSEGIYHDLGALRPMQGGEQLLWTPPAGAHFMAMDALSFVVSGRLPLDAGTVVLGEQSFSFNDAIEIVAAPAPSEGESVDPCTPSVADCPPASTSNGNHHYLLNLGTVVSDVTQIEIEVGNGGWVLGGLTVWNSQLRGFEPLAAEPALKTTLSGDVKVYQRTDAIGRAWVASTARFVADARNGAEYIAEPSFDPLQVVIVEDERDVFEIFGGTGTVQWVSERPERLEMVVDTAEGGWLVVADAPFPGWTVTIDGVPTEWYPANVINRVVLVPAGNHTVVWEYQTPGLAGGVIGTVIGMVIMVAVAVWVGLRR